MDTAAQLKTVNESGFPLQIAVSHIVETNKPAGWKVRYMEHAWQGGGASGFIDVVLQNWSDTAYMVMECKRVRDVDWIFLASDGRPKQRRQCKCWVTRYIGGEYKFFGWHECPMDPTAYEASFCVIRGQGSGGSRPLLERVGSEVVAATEALALHERDYRPPTHTEIFRTYFNVIVTTAPLFVGTFDPATVSLTDGTLSAAEFSPVPFVRFRKQLSEASGPLGPSQEMPDTIARSRESTVFVVNSSFLIDFLTEFELDNGAANQFA